MYESYAWPGAFSIKREILNLFKSIKGWFSNLKKHIDKRDNLAE